MCFVHFPQRYIHFYLVCTFYDKIHLNRVPEPLGQRVSYPSIALMYKLLLVICIAFGCNCCGHLSQQVGGGGAGTNIEKAGKAHSGLALAPSLRLLPPHSQTLLISWLSINFTSPSSRPSKADTGLDANIL